ncbi:hypothetical protein E6W36_13955 [Hankyongella ginsenosidimutans]|uniref:Phosphoribosylformylglycinamidine cyclo-ligase n=1 Tax=Hankyongella ginsenosidimutans TaxID=1763828 RepID=A0A4D7C7T7_9SPHN|nr:hypothetical protein E6W36_13955 [Hankyongella ginsenosidimutans]
MSDTKPITYADAGVSIDAGNALVRAIAPVAAATRRPGADVSLGGFGAFSICALRATPTRCSSPAPTALAPRSSWRRRPAMCAASASTWSP